MDFRIPDTFTASLMKLTGQEQKAVKTTAFDLRLDSCAPWIWTSRTNLAGRRQA
jgi:hypothetical protein